MSERTPMVYQMSGGLDSVAAFLVHWQPRFQPIFHFVNYGQPYLLREQMAVEYMVMKAGAILVKQNLTGFCLRAHKVGNVDAIPIRNCVLGMLSANVALGFGADAVIVGNKSAKQRPDDPWSFADSTQEAIESMSELVWTCREKGSIAPDFIQPLLGWSKAAVIRRVRKTDIDRSKLWSCYGSGPKPCGECYHCNEIEKALEEL